MKNALQTNLTARHRSQTASDPPPRVCPQAVGAEAPDAAAPRRGGSSVDDFLERLQLVEPFETVSTLGSGSSSTCYLMRRDDGTQVVQKRIPVSHMSGADQEKAEREVNILASLEHPHIIQYEKAYVTQGSLVIVTEHASGGDLAKHLASLQQAGKRLPLPTALEWSVQLLLALKYMHSRRVLHRDIAIKNIFLTASGLVKLGDFGVSRVLDSTAEMALTKVGTPCYISPERCEGKPYSYASDGACARDRTPKAAPSPPAGRPRAPRELGLSHDRCRLRLRPQSGALAACYTSWRRCGPRLPPTPSRCSSSLARSCAASSTRRPPARTTSARRS